MITKSAFVSKAEQAKIELELELILKGWSAEWLNQSNITIATCFAKSPFNNNIENTEDLLVFKQHAGHIELHLSKESKELFAKGLLKLDSLEGLNTHDLLLIDNVINNAIQRLLLNCVDHFKVGDSSTNTGINITATSIVMLSNIHFTLYFSSQILSSLINVQNRKLLEVNLPESSLSTQKQEFNLILKTIPITVEELMNLQIGSVVKLEQKINKPVYLHSKLSGHLINSNQHKSLLIRDIND